MMNPQVENLSNDPKVRIQSILSQHSLSMRCQQLSSLLEEASTKDSLYLLRVTIESIFGASEESIPNVQQQSLGGGWGLRVITLSDHSYEFNSLRVFLSPTGPLLKLIYRLTHDPFQLLPFPIAWLPSKVKTEIEDGTANFFYTNKIQNLGPGKSPTNIMLNAFEYYLFHFTHFLVGTHSHHWNITWGAVNDALYLTLLEDYLLAFLPCDGTMPPGPPSVPVSPRGVLSPMAQRHYPQTPNLNLSNLVSPIARPTRPSSESPYAPYPLFDLTSGSSTMVGAHASSPLPHQPQKEVNTWTSQVFFQILLEMWINQCVPPVTKASLHQQSQPSSPTSLPSLYSSYTAHGIFPDFLNDFTPLHYRPLWDLDSFKDVFLPSSDHVRVVRIMVKHFHYFTNSIKPNQANHLDYLKKNLWPTCRKSFYIFMKHLFLHWPLDSSFRLVLETWLSYIQPWRYTQISPHVARTSPGQLAAESEGPRLIDKKWMSFIAENLLFYTHMFVLLIGRLLRLDLVSPKNAQIIFRVAKIFSQENLAAFIQEIEDSLGSGNLMQRSILGGASGNLRMGSGTPSHSSPGTDSLSSHQLTQLVRCHILEVEGLNHQYMPLFSDGIAAKVSQFLKVVKNAQDAIAAELVSNSASKTQSNSKSWTDSFWKLFQNSQSVSDENTVDEVQRSHTHLDLSIKHFCSMFKISPPETGMMDLTNHNLSFQNRSNVGSPDKHHEPDMLNTENGPILTNLGRYQLLNGLKRYDLKYEGDPDLRPICTYEIRFLVRFLYHLAQMVNDKYKFEISDLYYRHDFVGRLARVFISSPQTVYEYNKCDSDSPTKRSSKSLPPRISLRPMANKNLLGAVFLFYSCLYILGLSSCNFTLYLLVPAFVLYIIVQVFTEPQTTTDRPHHEPLLTTSPVQAFATPRDIARGLEY